MRTQYDCINPRCLHLSMRKDQNCCIWCARWDEKHPQKHTNDCETRYFMAGSPSMRIFRVK